MVSLSDKNIAEKQQKDSTILSNRISHFHWKAYQFFSVIQPSHATWQKGYPKLYIPHCYAEKFFHYLHKLSHPGRHATTKLINDHFVWSNMSVKIKTMTQYYLQYQKRKFSKHIQTPQSNFQRPDSRLTPIHMDIVGPLPNALFNLHACYCGLINLMTCYISHQRYFCWNISKIYIGKLCAF